EQEFFEHTVEAGTTLSALARAYKVSVKDIEKANKIRKGRIYTGQKLLIPVSKKK
ncbi:MAG: LysM peptidoglycan-binding domain-containing protein, partial [Lentisphaeria bacterium]|nr:LysM peptidoglycan-binding domain-containing protein [Lentisphaeria bacterium]